MNKLSNLLLAVCVVIFLLSFGIKSEAVGQCPAGYTHFVDTLLVQGCYYEVDLCVECTVTHPGNVTYNSIKKLDDSCPDTLDPNETVQQILSQVSTWAYVYNEVCLFSLPPCDPGPSREITFKYPICWLMKKDSQYDQTWYLACDDSYCEITYEICMTLPDMEVQKTEKNRNYVNYPPSCNIEGKDVQEPTLPNHTSECYILHTPCNPDGGWIIR